MIGLRFTEGYAETVSAGNVHFNINVIFAVIQFLHGHDGHLQTQ